jgi:hypothetical protein
LGDILRKAAWAPAAVLVAHELGARAFGHEPLVDPVMHFLGGSAIAYFVYRVCRIGGGYLGAPSRLVIDLLALGLACVVALMWEFGEFLSDRFLGSHAHTSVGNTLRDLFLGMVGALACIGIVRLFTPRGHNPGPPADDACRARVRG